MNRNFFALPCNSNLPKSFCNSKNVSAPVKKYHLLDTILPIVCTKIEDVDGTSIQFVGHCAEGEYICYVDQYGDDNLTNFYVYKYDPETCNKISRFCIQSVPNIRGSKSFHNKILSTDRTFCLLFSEEGSVTYISSLFFGADFKTHDFCEDILVLTDCRRGGVYCLSPSNNLLAAVQCYRGSMFTYLTIHFIQVLQYKNGTTNVKAKLLSNETLQTKHESNLLDCQIICGCTKIIFITDSHSKGNDFICCSVGPFVKLFSTKIQCNRENGWFFVGDDDSQTASDKLVTFKSNGDFDGVVEVFSCDDDRTFIPMKSFLISELGFIPEQPILNTTVIGYRLFLITLCHVFIIDLNSQRVMFRLRLGMMARYNQLLTELRESDPDKHVAMGASKTPISSNKNEVIVNHWIEYEERCEQIVNVYMLPQQQRFTLFGLCRLSVLRNFSKERISTMELPSYLKDSTLSLKSVFHEDP